MTTGPDPQVLADDVLTIPVTIVLDEPVPAGELSVDIHLRVRVTADGGDVEVSIEHVEE